jgi:hypothetical protein
MAMWNIIHDPREWRLHESICDLTKTLSKQVTFLSISLITIVWLCARTLAEG